MANSTYGTTSRKSSCVCSTVVMPMYARPIPSSTLIVVTIGAATVMKLMIEPNAVPSLFVVIAQK